MDPQGYHSRVDMAVLLRHLRSICPHLIDVVTSHSRLGRETLRSSMVRRPRVRRQNSFTCTRARLTARLCAHHSPQILEPRKLILTAISNISRKFAPTKITRYTVRTYVHCVYMYIYIRESVDSLCRDETDAPKLSNAWIRRLFG